MSKEASVAPKERVNIRYRPATGDMKEDVELPLKMLVLGDFTLKEDDTPLEDRKKINIDKDNFNDVMREQKLSLQFSVENTLEGGGDMAVSLKFETLKDFEPESVAASVPDLKKLLELREALKSLRDPLGNVTAFRKRIDELLKDPAARARLLTELNLTPTN